MIISKFEIKNLIITLETGKLENSEIIYFFVLNRINNEEKGIITLRTFIYDEALKNYLSHIKTIIEGEYINDLRPVTEKDIISPA